MKADPIKRILLPTGALLFAILTCFGQDDLSGQMVGTWTKSLGQGPATFTMTADQKYQVYFTGGEEADVWGSYKISGKQITFTDEGGQYGSDSSGTYEFEVGDTKLSFTNVDDPVNGRSMLVEGTWSKAGNEEK